MLGGSESLLDQKLWHNISWNHFFSCLILGLVCESEIWHFLRKPALIFLNDYVPTPNIPDFKGLLWEIWNMKSKNYQKVVLKALGHILYGSNFIASDVIFIYLSF